MILSNNFEDIPQALEGSSNWNSLYCSRLWNESVLRNEIINKNIYETDTGDNGRQMTKHCYQCKISIGGYQMDSCRDCTFMPRNHSTPNGKLSINDVNLEADSSGETIPRNSIENYRSESIRSGVPSISRQIDTSCRRKYSSNEVYCSRSNNNRLRKGGLKGIRCFVSLSITDHPVKKRTRIQACSISVMIIAIVVISFVLVHFTSPSYKDLINKLDVPMESTSANASTEVFTEELTLILKETTTVTDRTTTIEPLSSSTTEHDPLPSLMLAKIRENLRTFPRGIKNGNSSTSEPMKRKEINNRDLSKKFCSCQSDEVCMLHENTGTAVCKKAIDIDDPTGCGGLCALETEACQIVDRSRDVRVCRRLVPVLCSEQQWRCRNGLCVAASARCDGTIHCYDRSDEMRCECDLNKHFRCGHAISCFPNTKLCDGIIDCWDGHDEVNCTTECPEHQFTCTDGECISDARFCDGLADCADGSDEPSGCDAACGTHELRCRNQRCVPRTALCDGRDHCGDSTDEMHCS